MYIVKDKRAIVVRPKCADTLLAAIPHARPFVHKGCTFFAIKHGLDEARVLRNLGFSKIPPPILHYYDWPARVPPMEHQKQTAAFLTMHRRALCLNAPGTGKTLSALWAADYLLKERLVKKVLVIAPLSTLKPVWAKELVHHFPHRRFNVLTGTRTARANLAREPDIDISIINHDGFTILSKELSIYDLIIYDEATALKSHGSRRYKLFASFVNTHNPWLWLMTGTPIAQNPTDAWTLARLVGSKTVPRSFTQFKSTVMQQVTKFKWVPRPEALDICKQVLQPSIRYDLSQCKDLPATTFIDVQCSLTKHQHDAYKELQSKAVIYSANITAANAAVLVQKLVQISCGVAYSADKDNVVFDDSNRVDTLKELLDEVGDKVIVYVPFRGVQDRLHTILSSSGYSVASVHGSVGKSTRDTIFHKFQNTDEIKVLLAHPKVAAHGLTLTRARHIIWYAPIYSLEMYEQANARIKRLTTSGKTVVYHIYATGFEKGLYSRLKNKKRILEDFLHLVKGVNE